MEEPKVEDLSPREPLIREVVRRIVEFVKRNDHSDSDTVRVYHTSNCGPWHLSVDREKQPCLGEHLDNTFPQRTSLGLYLLSEHIVCIRARILAAQTLHRVTLNILTYSNHEPSSVVGNLESIRARLLPDLRRAMLLEDLSQI